MNLRRGARRASLQPVEPPNRDAISSAIGILRQQELAVYQRLFREGLTSPSMASPILGAPFDVRRDPLFASFVRITPKGYAQWAFKLGPLDDIGTALPKAEALFAAINEGRQPCHSLACCPLAVKIPCVCIASFNCALHGSKCHGSHD